MTTRTSNSLYKIPKIFTSLLTFTGILFSEYITSLTNTNPLSNTPIWLSAGSAIGLCFLYGRHVIPIIFIAASIGTFLSFNDTNLANTLVYSVFYSLCLVGQTLCIYQIYTYYSTKDNPLENNTNLMIYLGLSAFIALVTSVLINIIYAKLKLPLFKFIEFINYPCAVFFGTYACFKL
jgi:hypothetical protein